MTVSAVSASTVAAAAPATSGGITSAQIQQFSQILNDTTGQYSVADQIDAWNSLIQTVGASNYGQRSLADRQTVAQAISDSPFGSHVIDLQGQLGVGTSSPTAAGQAQAVLNAFQGLSATDQQIAFGTSFSNSVNARGFSSIAGYVAYLQWIIGGNAPDASVYARTTSAPNSPAIPDTFDTVTLSPAAQSSLSDTQSSPSATSSSAAPTQAAIALQTLQAGAASDPADVALQTLKSINKALHDAKANASGSGATANGVTNALSQSVPVAL